MRRLAKYVWGWVPKSEAEFCLIAAGVAGLYALFEMWDPLGYLATAVMLFAIAMGSFQAEKDKEDKSND